MKKEEVELVLEKSLDFWRKKLKENITLRDIHILSFNIWKELEDTGYISVGEDDLKVTEYWLSISDIKKMELLGHKIILEDSGREIHLIVKDFFDKDLIMESGKKFD
jgi:hypothetical protein